MYVPEDEMNSTLSRWPLGVGWNRDEKNQSHSVNCEGCQRSEVFHHSHLLSGISNSCFEMVQLP